MEIKSFIEHIAEQFDDAKAEDIMAETRFRDIEGWSSLTALSIIAMVDEVYNVKMKGDDIRNSHTIGELFKLVNERF